MLPTLEHFAAERAGFFDTAAQAERRASLSLDALRLHAHTHHGAGAVRTLEAGKRYTLTEHPTLPDYAFVPLSIEHRAVLTP